MAGVAMAEVSRFGWMDRRTFMSALAALAALSLASCSRGLRSPTGLVAAPVAELPPRAPAEAPWITVSAVLAHLLPGGPDSPGAAEVNAAGYLYRTLSTPGADGDDLERLRAGAKRLDALVLGDYLSEFALLAYDQREAALRKLEASGSGQSWLSMLMVYLLEALLADPIYGGNSAEVGWRWLRHQPGFPRPPADHAWYRMASVSGQRKQKAVG